MPSDHDVASILLQVKKPRYAHMAKFHQSRGELAEAEYNYNLLADAQQRTLGETDPAFAAVLYELAKLNHHDEVPHAPDVQAVYDAMGRGTQVYLFYANALAIRETALGAEHPAVAQSLYGLATLCRDNGKIEEAAGMLRRALTAQTGAPDSLPAALSMIALADVFHIQKQTAEAKACYQESLKMLAYPSGNLSSLDQAAGLILASASDPQPAAQFDAIQKAMEMQSPLFDPYFKMTAELFAREGGELLSMVLELHRIQYAREYRAARIDALRKLASIHRELGEPVLAQPLLQEAAELLSESP